MTSAEKEAKTSSVALSSEVGFWKLSSLVLSIKTCFPFGKVSTYVRTADSWC